MRKYYWYISAFTRKHGAIVLISVIAAVLLFSLSLPFLSRIFEFKRKVYIGIVGQYTLTSLPLVIQKEISNGLTKIEPNQTVLPDLAERWNVEDDGKTYRFLIRKNIFWQDGKELEPSDIQYNFNDVQTITTPNEVIFKLNEPFVPFPSAVSQPIFRVVNEPYFFIFRRRRLVGTSKFGVIDYKERGQQLTEITINGPTDQKVYRFYLTEDDAIAAFKRGEVDWLNDFASAGGIVDWPNVEIKKHMDTNTYLGLFFNTEFDTFSNNDLRQALNYALEKTTDDSRALGPINPKSWAFADVSKPYLHDEQRAIERILSPSVLPQKPLHFNLTTTALFANEAEAIKQEWENFGLNAAAACQKNKDIKDKNVCENVKIKVDLKISNFPDLNDYQVLLIGQEIPIDPDQYALWHSKAVTNFTHYKNVRIDSLLERGRQTEDRQRRFEIYSDFQQFFSEDAPVIFLKYLEKYDIHRKGK